MSRGKLIRSQKRWAAGSIAAAIILAGVVPALVAPSASAQRTPSCSAVDVVVARGTDEPGTLGAEVGDPLFAALQRLAPITLSAYRVNYPATLDEPASVEQGSTDLVRHVTRQAARCPQERFVLVGYSQGAYVVDSVLGAALPLGLPTMPAWISVRVASVLLFGNPMRDIGVAVGSSYRDRTADFCINGDPICQLGGTDPAAHLEYGIDIIPAAAFAAAHL